MWRGAGGGLEESNVIGLPTVSAQGKCGNFLILYIYAMVATMRKCSYTLVCISLMLTSTLAGVLEAE